MGETELKCAVLYGLDTLSEALFCKSQIAHVLLRGPASCACVEQQSLQDFLLIVVTETYVQISSFLRNNFVALHNIRI